MCWIVKWRLICSGQFNSIKCVWRSAIDRSNSNPIRVGHFHSNRNHLWAIYTRQAIQLYFRSMPWHDFSTTLLAQWYVCGRPSDTIHIANTRVKSSSFSFSIVFIFADIYTKCETLIIWSTMRIWRSVKETANMRWTQLKGINVCEGREKQWKRRFIKSMRWTKWNNNVVQTSHLQTKFH